MQQKLRAGSYEVGLLSRVTLRRNDQHKEVDLWPARDAVVMKALACMIQEALPLSARCMHLKGHGGLKQAVRDIYAALPQHQFVLKTDVRSYYASVDHRLLIDKLAKHIVDERVINLVVQYLRRGAERGGLFWDHRKGLSLGCPLSPIMGAFFLSELDDQLDQTGLFWRRFMDDILVFAPTRWKLRTVVMLVNQVLASLRLEKHPDKTFIGRISKGFDFLGYHFSLGPLGVAQRTITKFVTRTHQLYEQRRDEAHIGSRLEAYVRRWVIWVRSGLNSCVADPISGHWFDRYKIPIGSWELLD